MVVTTGQLGETPVSRTLTGTFVVTGAGSGLGLAIAKAIAAAGGTAISFDVQESRETDADVTFERVDVSDYSAVRQKTDEIARERGDFRGVVANAGIDACGKFADVDADRWDRVIRVNLLGTANLVRAALPHLKTNKGRVVTVASTLGLRAVSDATAYCASKFGVVGFTRALATELAGEVPVTLLIPGGMHTAFFDGRDPQYKPAPDAKLNKPENVAQAVLFALTQPEGCEVREMLVCPSTETSWP